ncbi:hypothetical protein GCM10008027_34940 [Pseudoalteromonas gelatinilytica]|uniref:Uncharacterized protein n=1 Tax=Pseudoalteromonas gelatinilytica TaxID=1703256 RepID=A0ABQ1TYY5_9GAMM|nr:hypothetical protein GCM10008027_34940 [Pseudoalteromonas profundi]
MIMFAFYKVKPPKFFARKKQAGYMRFNIWKFNFIWMDNTRASNMLTTETQSTFIKVRKQK